jgi:hypothetical protein
VYAAVLIATLKSESWAKSADVMLVLLRKRHEDDLMNIPKLEIVRCRLIAGTN